MLNDIVHRLKGLGFREKINLIRLYMKAKWKQRLGLAHYDVLGLDIGTSSIRMVQLSMENDKYAVVAANVVDIVPQDEEAPAKEADFVKALQKCLDAANTRSKLAVCSVSGPEVAVRHFKFPPLQPQELEGAIRLEASQVCPFSVDTGVIDYQIILNEDNSAVGVFVAATNDIIKRKTRLLDKCSLNCVLMDTDGLALLNCLSQIRKGEPNITSSAILDVGASCTTLAVMGENGLPFVRTVPYAGNDIIALIAQENNVRPEVAKKDVFGNTRPAITQENLQKGLEKACGKLVTDVAETLRYHSAQEKSSPVDQLLVCGTFGMVRGFVDILNKLLPIKAILWNPFDTMHCAVGRQCLDVIQAKGPAMAVAAGLAMRSV